MNKQIKDFLEQAHTYSFQENRGQFVLNDFAEKFAELIVKECAEICLEANDHKNILHRFGVEEQTPSQRMAAAGYTRRPKGWTKEDKE